MTSEPTTLSDLAAVTATFARLSSTSAEDSAALGLAVRRVMEGDPLQSEMTMEDALAAVTLAREFHRSALEFARAEDPSADDGERIVFYSGCMDSLLRRAIEALERTSGKSAERFAWSPLRTVQ